MDAARSDVLLQRGIAHIRDFGLPEELCDYLARSWITHVETFERCRTEGEVTMAAGWARRHAKVAAAVLAMPSPVSSQDTPPAPRPAREWRDRGTGIWEEDADGRLRLLKNNGKRLTFHRPWCSRDEVNELFGPLTQVPSPSTQTGGHQ